MFFALPVVFVFSCQSFRSLTPTQEFARRKISFPRTDTLLNNLLASYPGYFDSLLRNKDKWRIQIIYTQINRDGRNRPKLLHYYFNVDPSQYFYPASTVKMPAAILALQKLNELGIHGLNKETTMITEASASGETPVFNDPSSEDGRPSVANYIKKMFLVSDNDAYNRLYEFLGQAYLNNSLHQMGYDSVQHLHRLDVSLTTEQNRTTNPVKFYDTTAKIVYEQPLIKSDLHYQPRLNKVGKGYISAGKLVNEPFDFSNKNRFALTELHSVLQSIMFPETVSRKYRFNLREDDYHFLYKYMSMKPGESRFPQYDSSYADAYVKFLIYGGGGHIETPSLRIFNKVGDAYGFLTDVAYIVDFATGVEFMLSASIYCNSDGILNDDKYDYDSVGFPFLKHLGEVIYQYELNRKKKKLPDLSKFKIDYR